jgi:hypothetical protein
VIAHTLAADGKTMKRPPVTFTKLFFGERVQTLKFNTTFASKADQGSNTKSTFTGDVVRQASNTL